MVRHCSAFGKLRAHCPSSDEDRARVVSTILSNGTFYLTEVFLLLQMDASIAESLATLHAIVMS